MKHTRFWNFYQEEPETEETEETERPGEPETEDIRPVDVIDISGEIIAGENWHRVNGYCFATDFRRALDGVGDVTVRINSPGGDVLAGAEIYSALREHSLNGKGRVRVEIMALAASAASVIAMAGDTVWMYPTAYMMIHNPWTDAVGDAREMRKAAKTLDEIARGLINAYKIKTGKTEDQLKKMLDAETWMSAGTCVMEGFADGVIGANGAGQKAAAMAGGRDVRVMMAARSHGIKDLMAYIRAEEEPETDPEEPETDPEEEPETEETEPDARADGAPASAEAEEDGDPEEDPEEETDPDDPEETDAEATEEEPTDPEEEPETEETEPDARAEGTDEEPEEEPADPEEDPDEETDPDDPEEAEDMARTEARAALMDEILQVRILMGREM